jgi:hypothetical protein
MSGPEGSKFVDGHHHPELPRRQALFSELYKSNYCTMDYSITTGVVSAFRFHSVMLYPLVNGNR